ncbi:MAG TPA: cellulase family glycosylhydrolase [bacterium]|nr:cellulase family glycosylhydrolase [bacterium]HPN45260.1 cellulase family glycosylhydrolase [bacterium]
MRNKINALVIFSLFLFSFPANAFIKTQGHNFVDENNNKVFLRGIGLGGWLVPEGYMLHIPGFGSPTSIRALIADLLGEADTQEFYSIYEANYVAEVDIQKIAEMGFNSVRLPFNYRMLSPENQPGVFFEEGFQVIDTFIEWCKKYNLYVILDMHACPGGQNNGNISDSDGQVARLWTQNKNQDNTVLIWKKIAERYANESIIVGYDLINEPVLPSGYTNVNLRNLLVRLTNEIRKIDTNHVLFMEGNTYATDFNQLPPAWDDNMAWSFHKYWSATDKASIQSYLNLRQQTNIPLWMGESGENSNPWFNSTIKTLEDNNISWCWWTHKKIANTTNPYSAEITDDYQTVLDYWDGNGSRPTAAFAKNALFTMAENLALEKCTFLPDVVDAIFNRDFPVKTKPYKELTIPGAIACADYDMGGLNRAYYDTDYQQTRWDESQPWNTGGEYRNDGVDIEMSNDAVGSPYSVGWIENGEWLNYTVTVTRAGTYNINFRYAANSADAKLQMYCNTSQLTDLINLPNSNGWYNWRTFEYENVHMDAGVQTLTMKVITSGFNINQVEFKLVKADQTDIDDYFVPGRFQIGSNYPNPFNRTTRIPFKLEDRALANINIYDVNGRLIRTLSKATVAGIADYVDWDGADQQNRRVSSGVYFYRLEGDKYDTRRKMTLIQ